MWNRNLNASSASQTFNALDSCSNVTKIYDFAEIESNPPPPVRRRQLEQSEEDATAELRGSLVLQGIRSHTTEEFDATSDHGDMANDEAYFETKVDHSRVHVVKF